MSSRFHNKWHRHNHHTVPLNDSRYPDSSHDPIASPDSPFRGDFVVQGTLSASSPLFARELSAQPVGIFTGEDVAIRAIAPQGNAIEAVGNVIINGTLSAADVTFTGTTTRLFSDPVIATGNFLIVNVNGIQYGLRLWTIT